MKAAVFREVGKPIEIEQVAISKPGPNEVLIKTAAAGVCHSDLHFIDGSYPWMLPAILGHESAGVVEQVGANVTYVKPGDHVITCLSIFCGTCEHCLSGNMSLCSDPEVRTPSSNRLSQGEDVINQFLGLSSFAEQMLVHEHALVKIREDMPLDRAALIGCGVTTGIGAVQNTAGIRPGETIAIIGCGGVGLSAVNGAAIAGAGRIIAIDMIGSKLNLAKEFGATDVIDASKGDPVEQVRELTGGGVHYAIECIGLKATAEQAWKMCARGGTAVIVGMIKPGEMVEIHGPEFLQGKGIIGSAMGSNRFRIDMPRYIDAYLAGKLKLDELLSQTLKLEDINSAFEDMKKGEVARSVIVFDS